MPDIIKETQDWIEEFVIGLNLCPFANEVFRKNQIRYIVSPATDTSSLLKDLRSELQLVAETTLLIHPYVLADFLEYNDFLSTADDALIELKLVGKLQIASFHPQYQFAGTNPADVGNKTNQSPYPMLHILREDSVAKAIANYPDAEGIPARNIETLRKKFHSD